MLPPPTPPAAWPAHVPGSDPVGVKMFTRFLFSALVDAGRSCTARFYARHMPAMTAADLIHDDTSALTTRLDAHIDAMPPKGSPAVVDLRRRVQRRCRRAGSALRPRPATAKRCRR